MLPRNGNSSSVQGCLHHRLLDRRTDGGPRPRQHLLSERFACRRRLSAVAGLPGGRPTWHFAYSHRLSRLLPRRPRLRRLLAPRAYVLAARPLETIDHDMASAELAVAA